jgi:hypothetical protein
VIESGKPGESLRFGRWRWIRAAQSRPPSISVASDYRAGVRQECDELRRDALDADGIICDIGRSLDLLKTVLPEFDYRSLDEFAGFRGRNTTREFLSCHKRLMRRIEEGALGSQASTSLRVVLRENQIAWSAYDAPL